MITIDAAATLLHNTLEVDAVLADANHLTSAGRIFKTTKRPSGFQNPTLTIRLIPSDLTGEQRFALEWLLWLNLYLQDKASLTPDHSRAGRIETRLDALIDNKEFSDSNVTRLVIDRYLPTGSPLSDPDAPDESLWQFQYYARAMN